MPDHFLQPNACSIIIFMSEWRVNVCVPNNQHFLYSHRGHCLTFHLINTSDSCHLLRVTGGIVHRFFCGVNNLQRTAFGRLSFSLSSVLMSCADPGSGGKARLQPERLRLLPWPLYSGSEWDVCQTLKTWGLILPRLKIRLEMQVAQGQSKYVAL